MYGSSLQSPVMNHQFKVNGGWARYYFLGYLLIHGFVITPVQMLLMLVLKIPPQNTLIGVIVLGLLMELLAVAGYMVLIVTSKSVTVSREQLVIRKILNRTTYQCSDIVNIRCETTKTTRGQHYEIILTFRDRTEYRVIQFWGNKFREFAIYLLQMLDAGMINPQAIAPEHRGRLHLYAQGKGWR